MFKRLMTARLTQSVKLQSLSLYLINGAYAAKKSASDTHSNHSRRPYKIASWSKLPDRPSAGPNGTGKAMMAWMLFLKRASRSMADRGAFDADSAPVFSRRSKRRRNSRLSAGVSRATSLSNCRCTASVMVSPLFPHHLTALWTARFSMGLGTVLGCAVCQRQEKADYAGVFAGRRRSRAGYDGVPSRTARGSSTLQLRFHLDTSLGSS